MRTAVRAFYSPWFQRSMRTEISDDALRAMEPRDAVLSGVCDRSGTFKTARVRIGGATYEATARTAPEALRRALAQLEAVELITLLTGPAA